MIPAVTTGDALRVLYDGYPVDKTSIIDYPVRNYLSVGQGAIADGSVTADGTWDATGSFQIVKYPVRNYLDKEAIVKYPVMAYLDKEIIVKYSVWTYLDKEIIIKYPVITTVITRPKHVMYSMKKPRKFLITRFERRET